MLRVEGKPSTPVWPIRTLKMLEVCPMMGVKNDGIRLDKTFAAWSVLCANWPNTIDYLS